MPKILWLSADILRNNSAAYLVIAGDKLSERRISVQRKSAREHGVIAVVSVVRYDFDVLVALLLVVVDGAIVAEDLEVIAMIIDRDRDVLALERAVESATLLRAPGALGGLAVEDDLVLAATEADVQNDIFLAIVKSDTAVVGVGVTVLLETIFVGPEDDEAILLQLILERDAVLVADREQIKHDMVCCGRRCSVLVRFARARRGLLGSEMKDCSLKVSRAILVSLYCRQ